MNIVTAQLNYTIGDLSGNTQKIIDVIRLHADSADLIVFSELCVTGYYPKDLLDRSGFIEDQLLAIDRIKVATEHSKAAVVLGTVKRNPFAGKPYVNALELIEDGQTVYQYTKQLLPTYGVFDEARHFEPGNQPGLFKWKDIRIGFLICEDAWEDENSPLYQRNPIAQLEGNELDVVISINASPYNIYKRSTRHTIMSTIAKRCACPVFYVNQVGGIDDLVFDGNSMVFDQTGACCFEAPMFEEDVSRIDSTQLVPIAIERTDHMERIAKQLVLGLKDYCEKSGFKKVVIGSSGGIDSAVTLAIASLAMGAENVTAITMPSRYSSAGSVDDSVELCNALGVELYNSPIKSTFDAEIQSYIATFDEPPSSLGQENLQARIRGQRLMTYSNSTGAMVVSTGNKTEMSVGYCTLYGDMAGGVSLLADLYKGQVYELAEYLNESIFGAEVIPNAIINKEPSAELAEDQVDSDALPPYDQLDAYLQILLEEDLLSNKEIALLSATAGLLSGREKTRIGELLDRNEYKRRQAAPVIRVNRRSFGADRQIPLTLKMTS